MTAGRPTLSICVPAYNQADFVGEAVESALAIGLPRMEVLVSDDASSDGTLEAVSRFGPPVRVLSNPTNLGMVPNWNRCLEQSRGEYVVLLSGDDVVEAGFLRRAVALMRTRPTVGMASGQTTRIDEAGNPTGLHRPWSDGFTAPGTSVLRDALDARGWNIIGNPSCVVLRREAAVPFDLRYRQFPDWAAWVGVLSRWHHLYLDEPSCRYRQHGGQATVTNLRAHSARTELERLHVLASLSTEHQVPADLARACGRRLRREAWKSAARLALRGSPRRAAWRAARFAGPWGPLSLPGAALELLRDRAAGGGPRRPPSGSSPVPAEDLRP